MNNYNGTLFIISAASGVGKTSLVKAVMSKLNNVVLSVSHTTRPKRSLEREALDYFFVTKEQFLQMNKEQEFLETAEIFGNYYGTSKKFVLNNLTQGADIILEIDYQGTKQIRQQFYNNNNINCLSIFILPPSLKILTERIISRKQDDYSVIQMRLNNAKQEMLNYIHYDYLVINENLNDAVNDILNIIYVERLTVRKQQHIQANLINNLLKQ